MVTVVFSPEVAGMDDKKKSHEVFHEADSFGLSQTGDLILVKFTQEALPPNMPPGAKSGQNIRAFAAGTWLEVLVETSKIETSKIIAVPSPHKKQ